MNRFVLSAFAMAISSGLAVAPVAADYTNYYADANGSAVVQNLNGTTFGIPTGMLELNYNWYTGTNNDYSLNGVVSYVPSNYADEFIPLVASDANVSGSAPVVPAFAGDSGSTAYSGAYMDFQNFTNHDIIVPIYATYSLLTNASAGAPPSAYASAFAQTTFSVYENHSFAYTQDVQSSSSYASANKISFSMGNITPGEERFTIDVAPNSYSEVTVETYATGFDGISAPVPEPSTFALLGLGGIGSAIGSFRRRRAAVV